MVARTRTRTPPPAAPPRLERVPSGYTPPPIRHGMTPSPSGAAALHTVPVTAEAAIRAGVRQGGDLARDPALRLFHLAAARKASGQLRIRAGGREIALVFRAGIPEQVHSSEPADNLMRFLLERGVIDPGALVEHGLDDEPELALVSWLLTRRDAADVERLVKDHGVRLILRALRSEVGAWEWEPHAHTPSLGAPLGSPFALLGEAVRALDPETVRLRLGDRRERRAALVGGAFGLEELGLAPEELAAATLFDGSTSPQEVANGSASASTVLRVALLLLEIGLLASEG